MTTWTKRVFLAGAAAFLLTAGSAVATAAGPTNVKFYGAGTVGVGGTTTLDLTINNGTGTNFTAVTGSDILPSTQVIATPNGLLSACTPGSSLGTLTAVAGSSTVTIGTSTILAGGACTVQVNVTGTMPGSIPNSFTADDAVGGPGNAAIATLSVLPVGPPSIAKTFGAASIPVGGSTSLTFTLTASQALTGVSFIDNLPAGLVVATPTGLSTTCAAGTIVAAPGSSTVSASGVTFAAAGSCTVTANVTGVTAGTKVNSVTVSDVLAGVGNTATASIVVVVPPTLTKSFGSTQLDALYGPFNTTPLTFTVNNPNPAAISGIGFTDTLPAGMFVSNPGTITGSCDSGTITAAPSSNVISLSGATLAANASCTFSVNVTAQGVGTMTNTTTTVSSSAGSGPAATASTYSSDMYLLWFFS